MKALIKSHPVWAYSILAYGISWLIQLPGLVAMQGNYRFTGLYLVLLNISSYGPSLAAIIVTAVTQGWPDVRALLKRLLRWRVLEKLLLLWPSVCIRSAQLPSPIA